MIISMADFKRFLTEENFTPTEATSTEEDFDAMPESGKVITLLENAPVADDAPVTKQDVK